MSNYILGNTVNYSSQGRPMVLRAGSTISDADFSIADLRSAGAVLTPADATKVEAAAQAAVAQAQAARGNTSPESASTTPQGFIYRRSGTATISGAATTQAVAFSPAEKDASYNLQVSCVALSGGAAAGSNAVYATSKATDGFTVATGTAPGVGETVTVDWSITRD